MHTQQVATILIIAALSSGCAVIDVDFEREEAKRIAELKIAKTDPFKNEPTPDYVKVIEEDDVLIEAIKQKPISGPQGLKLDVWEVNAINHSSDPKCVTVHWRLQDFQLETDLPYEFLINKYETVRIGRMKQTVWSFDDTLIALPPSGYAESVSVVDARFDEKLHSLTCEMLENEIDEPGEKDTLEL